MSDDSSKVTAVSREATADVSSEAAGDASSETTADVSSEATADVSSEATDDASSETTADVSSETTTDVSSEATASASSEATADVCSEVTTGVSSEATSDTSSVAPACDSSEATGNINLFLIGRTGNGKSSTGNSFLGKREFTPRGVSSAVIYDIRAGRSSVEGVPVVVVDGIDIGDSSTDLTDDGQSLTDLVKKALTLISYRFHALLVCLKYGVRFTNQEKEAVKMIKAIFGEDVIKNYGIIVMTHGDNFDIDTEDEGTTFESWCNEQTGDVHALLQECDNRCVLFDNKTTDKEKKKKQNEKLLKFVNDIKQNRHPYSENDFKKAGLSQNKLKVMAKLPDINLKSETFLNTITKRLEKEKMKDVTAGTDGLENIMKDLQDHKQDLEKEDGGTKSVDHLLIRITILETTIKTAIEKQKLKADFAEKDLQQKGREPQEKKKRKSQDAVSEDHVSFLTGIVIFSFKIYTAVLKFFICLFLRLLFFTKPRMITRTAFMFIKMFVGLNKCIWMTLLPDSVLKDASVVKAVSELSMKIDEFHVS